MREQTLMHIPMEIEEPEVDVLKEGWLHKVMVVFHLASRLPGWMVALLGLALAGLGGWAWWRVLDNAPVARAAVLIQALFMAGDMAILFSLPRRRLSFGPWKDQLLVLAAPRTLVTMALGLAALWFDWQLGLGLLILAQTLGTAAFMYGAMIEPFRLSLTELVVVTDRLPAATAPIRILHISDLHVERLTQREADVVRLAQEAKPDLIVITGDYVNLSYNDDPRTHAQVRQLLGQLSAPYGVYATLGSPPVDLREVVAPIFEGLPIPLLRKGWAMVDLGQGRQLVLLGLDCTHDIPTDAARLERLVTVAPNGAPQVLLYHSPELMPQAIGHDIDLYLCGHTHGGQVRLPLLGPILTSSKLGRRYVMGIYRRGRTHLYVSRGVGLEGMSAPRVRFLAPPEMTLVTLWPAGEAEG